MKSITQIAYSSLLAALLICLNVVIALGNNYIAGSMFYVGNDSIHNIDTVLFDMPYPTELDKYYDTHSPATPNPSAHVHRGISEKIQTGEPITYHLAIPYPHMNIEVQKSSLLIALRETFSDFDNGFLYVETEAEADFKFFFQPEGEILQHLKESSFKTNVLGLAIMPSPRLPDYLLGNVYFNASKSYNWLNNCTYEIGKFYPTKSLCIHEIMHSVTMNHSTTENCTRKDNGAWDCPCEVMRPMANSWCGDCKPTLEEKRSFKMALLGNESEEIEDEGEEDEIEGNPHGNQQDLIIAAQQATIDSLNTVIDNVIQSQIDYVTIEKGNIAAFRNGVLKDFNLATKIWASFIDRLNILQQLQKHNRHE